VDRWTKGRSQRLSKTVPSLNQGRKGSGARERGMMARHIKRVRSRRSPCEANGAEIHTRMYAGMRGEAGRDRRLGPFRWWEKKWWLVSWARPVEVCHLYKGSGRSMFERRLLRALRLPKQRGERAPESGGLKG